LSTRDVSHRIECHRVWVAASFYRLNPKIVINVENEYEVRKILLEANKLRLPVTFRAAGTSLSGQAISDSILVRLGAGWRNYSVLESASKIQLEPGIIGSDANAILAAFDKKIGPDPASIDSAKIGGILANNASALILYPDVKSACEAISYLQELPVAAAELMDRAALRSVEDKQGVPDYLKTLTGTVTALLVETRAETAEALNIQIKKIQESIKELPTVRPISFTDIPSEYNALWKIRKGLFPAVGAIRQTGTTVIIEDVAFPGKHLAEASLELQELFKKYGYYEAIIFGHALAANLHFVFTQDFSRESEVIRYRDFMDEVVKMVVEKYDGSLKAEHGTGRNMAPFVEKEWGEAAYSLMREIKAIFDPNQILNPGVILNQDAEAHIKNLKPLPPTHEIVDKCIECGFCEPVCPSKNLTFTPRQRIVARREISRKMAAGCGANELMALSKAYQYPGPDTCATDGLCGMRCPVEIDTGKMVKVLRKEANGKLGNIIADWVADNSDRVSRAISSGLTAVDFVHKTTGTPFMERASKIARKASIGHLPLWNREMPSGVPKIIPGPVNSKNPLKVVYFPSCTSRFMSGPCIKDEEREGLPQKTRSLLIKAGYEIIYPQNIDRLCCGQAFESKGYIDQADRKSKELSDALLLASDNGEIPVLCDTSPCLYRMRAMLDKRLQLFEPIEFVLVYLMKRLKFTQRNTKVAIHPTCSTIKMGLSEKLEQLARACAKEVVMPREIYCCGFAGDLGFKRPELNVSALKDLNTHVCTCEAGYSTSKTCEIGLSLHGGIPYRSILYLVDEASEPMK
jgi:D-lactate dehydrogenase